MRTLPNDGKTANVVGDIRQAHVGGGRFSEHHIASTGTGTAIDRAVRRAQNNVCQAIAIDVACAADAVATLLSVGTRDNGKAANARGNLAEVNGRIGCGTSKDDIGFASGRLGGARQFNDGANDDVTYSVTIDVAATADGYTYFVLSVFTFDDKASDVVFDTGKIHGCVVAFPQNDIRST